jgi:hypothetical protein
MSMENLLWGAPRIHGELLKLGFEVAQSTVAKYMVKRRDPRSQGWRTFLRNHAPDTAAMNLFVVSTIGFKLLHALVIVRLHRGYRLDQRHEQPDSGVGCAPDHRGVSLGRFSALYDPGPGSDLRCRCHTPARAMGIRDKPIAPASPWQNGVAERLIGSIRRECVDHIIVFGEMHLRRVLKSYADYYNSVKTHRSLHKDAPISRPIHQTGVISARPILGGLHHHYVRV